MQLHGVWFLWKYVYLKKKNKGEKKSELLCNYKNNSG